MPESLRRGWWWWWWCAAVVVAAGQQYCQVLNLGLQPSVYPLPTNLTVRPLETNWHLNFTLQEGEAPPAACVRLKETESKVQMMLFKGGCGSGNIEDYNYLPPAWVSPHVWTSLAINIEDNDVLVTVPGRQSAILKAGGLSLPRDALQVTLAQGVEAAVGCRVNCPLYSHASEGPGVKKKVREWRRDNHHFYFRPGPVFATVYYEAVCWTQHGSESRRVVDIRPEGGAAARGWHLVEVRHQENKVDVHLDNKLLEQIMLPDACTSNKHFIWTVGDAEFGFDCDPREENEKAEDEGSKDRPDPVMHPMVPVGITVAVVAVVGLGIYFFLQIMRRKEPKQRNERHAYTHPSYVAATLQSRSITAPPTDLHTLSRGTTLGPPPSQVTLAPRTQAFARSSISDNWREIIAQNEEEEAVPLTQASNDYEVRQIMSCSSTDDTPTKPAKIQYQGLDVPEMALRGGGKVGVVHTESLNIREVLRRRRTSQIEQEPEKVFQLENQDE